MELDPDIDWILALREGAGLPAVDTMSVAEARAQYEATATRLCIEEMAMASVVDLGAPAGGGEIKVRAYVPQNAPAAQSPALVFYHGGGWTTGSADTHDRLCRAFAGLAGCKVLSVDYRLAPENKFPAAVEDAVAAYRWAVDRADELGIDPARIAVGGDSAGGNLSAVACHLLRDGSGPRPCFQLLIYPLTDARPDKQAVERNGDGFFLTPSLLDWYLDHYLGSPEERVDPRVSPLLASDLSGLPPALVVTAGFDPLHDQGVAYTEALVRAGVAVEHRDYSGMIHGFLHLSGMVDVARAAVEGISATLAQALATP